MDLESKHGEKKAAFDRLTVGLAVEQGNMEKECDLAQVSRRGCRICVLLLCGSSSDRSRCSSQVVSNYFSSRLITP